MAIIDSRLIDCDTDQDITENFNRVMALIDEITPTEPQTEVPSEVPSEAPSEVSTEGE